MTRAVEYNNSFTSVNKKKLAALIVLTCLILSFLVLESFCRLFINAHYHNVLLNANNSLYTYNAQQGWTLTPNTLQRFRTVDNEIVRYVINSHGFRGPNITSLDIDVLFVGDSLTFGSNAEKSYPHEFAQLTGASVVNGGVPGYGTDQSFLMTRHSIENMGLRPKRVVYGFFNNDIENNISRTNIHSEFKVHKPILNLDTGQYEESALGDNDISSKLNRDFGGIIKDLLSYSKLLRMSVVGFRTGYRLLEGAFHEPEKHEISAQQIKYLRKNLDNFRSYLSARNIEFYILHIPSDPKRALPGLDDALGGLLRKYGRNGAIPYIRASLTEGDYLPVDGHLSDRGAASVADTLTKALRGPSAGATSSR